LPDILEKIESLFADVASIEQAKELTQMALDEGISPVKIMRSMTDGLTRAGRKYEEGEFFLSELIMSGIMAQEVSKMLQPHMLNSSDDRLGKVVIGTVNGDIHDLGKNLVSMMLSCAGFEVVDLGVDVASEIFVKAVEKENPVIAAMSCLLTNAMNEMRGVIDGMEAAGVRRRVSVIVGGRPLTPGFAKEIGADWYGKDAIEGMKIARTMMKKEREKHVSREAQASNKSPILRQTNGS